MACPHFRETSGAGACVPGMLQTFPARHRAEVCPPTNQATLYGGAIDPQGLALPVFGGLHVEIPKTARRYLDQTVQVMYLDVVVGETHLRRLKPPDPSHLGAGPTPMILAAVFSQNSKSRQKGVFREK